MTRIPLKLVALSLTCFSFAPFAAHAADEPEKVTAGAPQPAGKDSQESRMQRRADHIEGHIAYLKAELMITSAQEAAWDKVADHMRNAVKDYEEAVAKLPEDTSKPNAIDSLAERAQFANLKAKGESEFLADFKPLYDSFSDQQKQTADELFASSVSADNKNK